MIRILLTTVLITTYGENGNDYLEGGAGHDLLIGDFVSSGNGNDTISGGAGNDTIYAKDGDDLVYGGNDNDLITGLGGNDILYGENGDDNLIGGGGNDSLDGGLNNDTLTGGLGNDTLRGGAGADRFAFNNLSDGIDVIQDFTIRDSDKIVINSSFGASSTNQFSFDSDSGALSFLGEHFATINLPSGDNFIPSEDIVLL